MPQRKTKTAKKPSKDDKNKKNNTNGSGNGDNYIKLLAAQRDLDHHFQIQLNKLESDFKNKLKSQKAEFDLMLHHIPIDIQNMPMLDVIEMAENYKQDQVKSKEIRSKPEALKSKTKMMKASSDSNLAIVKHSSTKKVSTLKRTGSSNSLSKKPKKKTRDSAADEMVYTPQTNKKRVTSVTPKVDLSKPFPRSALRKPHLGEILLSLSGSPIFINSMDLSSLQMRNSTVENLNETKKMLKEKLWKN